MKGGYSVIKKFSRFVWNRERSRSRSSLWETRDRSHHVSRKLQGYFHDCEVFVVNILVLGKWEWLTPIICNFLNLKSFLIAMKWFYLIIFSSCSFWCLILKPIWDALNYINVLHYAFIFFKHSKKCRLLMIFKLLCSAHINLQQLQHFAFFKALHF